MVLLSDPKLIKKSKFFNLMNVQKTFTQSERPKSNGKFGIYTKEEWLATRKGNNSFFDTPSVYNLKRLVWEKFDGVKALYNLTAIYDFSTKKRIGEIGGIPFVQAMTLMELYPHID